MALEGILAFRGRCRMQLLGNVKKQKKNLMDFLDFKFYIAECLIAGASQKSKTLSSPELEDEPPQKIARSIEPLPSKDVRVSENKHLPICAVTDKNKFMRCRKEGCKQKTRFKCISCNIFMHCK